MSDLVPLKDKMAYAEAIAASDLLPKSYRGKPHNVLVAYEYGLSIGLSAMAAIQGIHVVEGKPTASAQLIGALVRRAGHRLRVTGNDQEARAVIIRADDPDFQFESVWTLERARTAGLVGKAVWRQYPAAMLKARAITEVARDACPEVLSGVAYTAEELGADDSVPAPAPAAVVVEVARPAPAPAERIQVEDVVDAEVVDESHLEVEVLDPPEPELVPAEGAGDRATPKQVQLLSILFDKAGMSDRAKKLDVCSSLTGRSIGSSTELTKAEAHEIIDNLKDLLESAENTDSPTP